MLAFGCMTSERAIGGSALCDCDIEYLDVAKMLYRVQHQPRAGVQRRAPVLHFGIWRRGGGGEPQVLHRCATSTGC